MYIYMCIYIYIYICMCVCVCVCVFVFVFVCMCVYVCIYTKKEASYLVKVQLCGMSLSTLYLKYILNNKYCPLTTFAILK